jgi:hypothetical protein
MNPSGGGRYGLAWLLAASASLLLASCATYPGYPAPPDVYENLGAANDFPVGVTRIGDGAWLLKTTSYVRAYVEKPGCPYSLQGTQLLDCRGREINSRPSGIAPENATPGPPYFDMLASLCTWVYPPAGDVWVYFEPWPGRSPRLDANGNSIENPNGGSGCPGQGRW